MDVVLWIASWGFAGGMLAAFGWLVFFAIRAAHTESAFLRRDAPGLTMLAGIVGLLIQFALAPFYVLNALGQTVHVESTSVSCGGRSGLCVVRGSYVDARRVRHLVHDTTSRPMYEHYLDTSHFVVVDGVSWLDQIGSRPFAPALLVVLGPLIWLGFFSVLRDPARARRLFQPRTRGSGIGGAVARRPDLRPINAGAPSLGAALHPKLLWWRDHWVGVLFDDVTRSKIRLGPRLVLQLSAFYPPLVVEPISRLGPWQLPGLLGSWFQGLEFHTGDAAFDADFAATSPCPAFARALLDPEGRALVRRLRAAGAGSVSLSGRSVTFLLGTDLESEPQVLEMFAAVEAWLTHLPPVSPPPPEGLCHLCGCELRAVTERCATCGGRFHHHCQATYGGCPLHPCAPAERIVAGITRFATTPLSGADTAETGPARPEHFASWRRDR